MFRIAPILVILALTLVASGVGRTATAATIRVAQDGSGDYTSLYDATVAVVDGDTLSIGPGVYDDMRDVILDGREFKAIGVITASNIHVVGDSQGSVFIGPQVVSGPTVDGLEYGVIVWFRASGASFSNLTVQNVARGIADTEMTISIKDCRFTSTYFGTILIGVGEASVVRCTYEDSNYGVIAFVRPGVERNVRVEGSSFQNCNDGVQLQGVNGWVVDCVMSGSAAGLTVLDGAHVQAARCRFEDSRVVGVDVSAGSDLWLEYCAVRGAGEMSVRVRSGGALYGHHNRLSAGTLALLWLVSPAALDFRDNHFLNAGGDSVWASTSSLNPRTVLLDYNWWGTTDTQQIESWIYHAPDNPEQNGLTVEYQPIANEAIPVRRPSMGRLKGRFGS